MSEENSLEKFGDAYENNPIMRALITLATNIPVAGMILGPLDEAALAQKKNMQATRFNIILDELAKGERLLTEELVQDHDFLHAYFRTLKAAINTRREKKIRLFVRLLQNSLDEKFYKTDEFEEFVTILDDLSMREFTILLTLKEYQDNAFIVNKNSDKNKLQIISTFWESFADNVSKLLRISLDETPALLTRLNRTGLYETFSGSAWDYEGGKGMLTPFFYKFIDKLIDDYTPENPET